MPTFSKISWESLQSLKRKIFTIMKEVQSSKSLFSFYLLLVWLYEYVQCYSKLKLESANVLENVSVKLPDIRKFTGLQSITLVKFKNVRDKICHGLDVSQGEIEDFLLIDDFKNFIKYFDFGEDFYDGLVETFEQVTVFTKQMSLF